MKIQRLINYFYDEYVQNNVFKNYDCLLDQIAYAHIRIGSSGN